MGPVSLRASVALAVVTVLAQIAYPLTPDRELGRLSGFTVLAFAASSVSHALATRGAAWTARLVLVVVPGAFAAEAVGVATGVPFGSYTYAHSLGPLLLGVPLLVPLAWLMMAYPCLLMGRTLTARLLPKDVAPQGFWKQRLVVAVVAGAALAAWDVFLDPQMVDAGHWTWADPSPGLPGIAHVPLTNLFGWLLVAVVLMAIVELALPWSSATARPTRVETVPPALLLGWTWVGGVVGNAVFFQRAWVAVWGGVLLGLFVAPYLLLVLEQVPEQVPEPCRG
jgi:uncharacterized membrane protein